MLLAAGVGVASHAPPIGARTMDPDGLEAIDGGDGQAPADVGTSEPPPDGADGTARHFVARADAVLSGTRLRLVGGWEVVLPDLLGPDDFRGGRTAPTAAAERTSAALADLTLGRRLRVDLLPVGRDRMGRLRARVRPLGPDGLAGPELGEEMVGRGLLVTMPEPAADPARIAALLAREAPARRAGRGLWGRFLMLRAAEPYDGGLDRFEVVEGTVARVGRGGQRHYLEFGRDWREDFTAGIEDRLLNRFAEAGVPIEALEGRRVRLRGWVRYWNGAYLELREAVQVEILD